MNNRAENTNNLPPTWEQGQGASRKAQLQEPYHFNSDELRVLRECNRESFYQRSLPFASVFGIGTYYAVKSGFLKGSARWGPAPKVGLAVIMGYFMGKFSYQKTCAEKIMALPNSPLGEMLRKKRQQQGGSSFTETLGIETGLAVPSVNNDSFEVYSDHGPRSMDLDTTRPLLDNTQLSDARPDLESDVFHEEPLPPAQHNTNYEELRRQNREEYERKKSSMSARGFSVPLEDSPPIIRAKTPSPASPSGEQNQYGDTWVR